MTPERADRPETAIFDFLGFGGTPARRDRVADGHRKRGFCAEVFTDPTRMMYLKGGAEHADAAALRARLIDGRRAYRSCIAFGRSGGGFAALRYGIICRFDYIVGVGAFTTFDAEATRHDPRGVSLIPDLWRAEPKDARRNIRFYLDKRGFSGRIALIYAAHNANDRYQAENLAGYPQVTLLPVDAEAHAISPDTGMGDYQFLAAAGAALGFRADLREDRTGRRGDDHTRPPR